MESVRNKVVELSSNLVESYDERDLSPRDRGWVRVKRVADEYRGRGFFVLENFDFRTGVDLLIIGTVNGRPFVKVIESTNYADKAGWIGTDTDGTDRFRRYVDSLNAFDVLVSMGFIVEKEILVSFVENLRPNRSNMKGIEDRVAECERYNIRVIACGGQD